MRLFCLSVFFISSVLFGHAFAEIKTTNELSQILEAVQAIDEHALVIFDVHDVLTIPADQLLRKPHKERLKKALADMAALRGNEEAASLESVVKSQHRVRLVDPQMATVLHTLKERHLAVIALTNARTGQIEGGVECEELLLARLKSLGIDFSDSFPAFGKSTVECTENGSQAATPVFKDGVVFTCQLPKGLILQSFLQKVGVRPTQILFVDDKQVNLESVEAFCNEVSIPFVGFRYTASARHALVPLNERRAELQLKVLKDEKRWMNDEEADQLLNTSP